MGFLLAYFHLKLDTDILLSGIAINMVANGEQCFCCMYLRATKGSSERLTSQMLPTVELPLLKDIPVLGEILSGHNVLTYVAFISVLVVWFLIFKTRIGLRIRAVGEYPKPLSPWEKSSTRIKLFALALSGFLAALGGIFLSMGYMNFFVKNMAAGRGFIGVAGRLHGRRQPLRRAGGIPAVWRGCDACNTLQTMFIPAELHCAFHHYHRAWSFMQPECRYAQRQKAKAMRAARQGAIKRDRRLARASRRFRELLEAWPTGGRVRSARPR